ncbi:MAG: UTP--glucose-1-phosphate uridylyltransferase GalU [Deltaproteobacteria bacterium]|nr:UTP--glucose-1-phosphate uridylyltransferase GalU [Deltaproteobacteria bacterium]
MKVRKAVIPAAGLGTRFLPATKSIPKEMIPIIDKPMIQYIVEECVGAGIEDIILITARGKDSIADHFDHSFEVEETLRRKKNDELLAATEKVSKMANIIAVRQKNPMGLGHAVLTARQIVGNEPFAVLLGDDLVVSEKPCIRQCIEIFEERQKSVIGVMKVEKKDTSKYGIVGGKMLNDRLMDVNVMVEKPSPETAPSQLACPGRYVLKPEIFEILANTKPGRGGEIQLTDALAQLATGDGLLAYLFDGRRYDTGDKLGYIEATVAFALKRPDLADGVRKVLAEYLS